MKRWLFLGAILGAMMSPGCIVTSPTPARQVVVQSGGVCVNTCRYAFDRECDDGRPGAHTSLCGYGTDCGDCGPG